MHGQLALGHCRRETSRGSLDEGILGIPLRKAHRPLCAGPHDHLQAEGPGGLAQRRLGDTAKPALPQPPWSQPAPGLAAFSRCPEVRPQTGSAPSPGCNIRPCSLPVTSDKRDNDTLRLCSQWKRGWPGRALLPALTGLTHPESTLACHHGWVSLLCCVCGPGLR